MSEKYNQDIEMIDLVGFVSLVTRLRVTFKLLDSQYSSRQIQSSPAAKTSPGIKILQQKGSPGASMLAKLLLTSSMIQNDE